MAATTIPIRIQSRNAATKRGQKPAKASRGGPAAAEAGGTEGSPGNGAVGVGEGSSLRGWPEAGGG
jgi:hypothetical protein